MANNKLLFSILWILLLIFIGWPIAAFCAGWWVIILPFEGVHNIFKQNTTSLEKVMSWPRDIGMAIIKGQEKFPSPW